MELALLDYSIDQLEWGPRTALTGRSLTILEADIRDLLGDLSHGIRIDYELARPGESKRIVHVLDTVLPIAKLSSSASAFPGFNDSAKLVGNGTTVRLKNLLVTVAGRFPQFESLS